MLLQLTIALSALFTIGGALRIMLLAISMSAADDKSMYKQKIKNTLIAVIFGISVGSTGGIIALVQYYFY